VALAGRYVGVAIEKPSPIQEASIPVALAGRYVGVVILMRYGAFYLIRI
jgi:hypothetical protein